MAKTIFQKLKDEGSLERISEVKNEDFFAVSFISIFSNFVLGVILSSTWGLDLISFMVLFLILIGVNGCLCYGVTEHPKRAWRFKRY